MGWIVRVLSFVGTLGVAAAAGAWGSDGHRIVCEMSWRMLAPETRREVQRLLPAGPYERFAQACTWADKEARGDPAFAWLAPYHYMNVDLRDRSVSVTAENCKQGRCVIRGIERFTRALRDPTRPRSERVLALRMLGHLVGDVHQPLHVAHRDGCGGCKVRHPFPGRRKPPTIHQIWDTHLIDAYIEPYVVGRVRASRGWEELAIDLAAQIRDVDRARWNELPSPVAWADESLAIAQLEWFRAQDATRLPESYPSEVFPVLAARLQQAGVRLSRLLDRAFGEAPLDF